MSYTCTRYCPGDKYRERAELFLSNGNSVVLEKSTVPELVMNVKLKSVPKAALQSGVYVTAALSVPCIPSISVTIMLSIQWVPVHVT